MALENRGNGKRLVFSETTYKKISRILYELNNRLKSHMCIFADINGYPIDYSGDNRGIDISTLTAVAAGSFMASNEIAHIISNEQHFEHVFHEGKRQNVYMCNVSDEFLMIIVFGKSVPIGLVRLLTHHAVSKLSEYLDTLKAGRTKIAQFLDAEFHSKLDKELDKAFGF